MCVERSVQDLQQHGNGRRLESYIIDEELRFVLEIWSADDYFSSKEAAYEGQVEVNCVVDTTFVRKARLRYSPVRYRLGFP